MFTIDSLERKLCYIIIKLVTICHYLNDNFIQQGLDYKVFPSCCVLFWKTYIFR